MEYLANEMKMEFLALSSNEGCSGSIFGRVKSDRGRACRCQDGGQ